MDLQRLMLFFAALRPILEVTRKVDKQLDRELARRFNVLNYIRDDEMGLSRVIADLLDPRAAHGQDVLFLDLFLRRLKETSFGGVPLDLTQGYGDEWSLRADAVRVRTERTIRVESSCTPNRRLDICVEFGAERCLVIENKTGAGDQQNQIRDYLSFLDREYGRTASDERRRYCLIYLSPQGEPPSRTSVDPECLQSAKGQFAVWSYSRRIDGNTESDADNAGFRLPYSVSDWLSSCRRACDVDRLRSFLRDAEGYCEREFGGVTMIESNREEIDRFLARPENLEVAATVVERWPEVRARIVERFAEHLKKRLERVAEKYDNLECRCSVAGRRAYEGISLFRGDDAWVVGGRRVEIRMEAQRAVLRDWIIGVSVGSVPTTVDASASATIHRALREALEKRLHLEKVLDRAKSSDAWSWFTYLNNDWRSWDDVTVVSALAQETEGGGEATNYLVDRFVRICDGAVPEIDKAVREIRNSIGGTEADRADG